MWKCAPIERICVKQTKLTVILKEPETGLADQVAVLLACFSEYL